jgi:apolipoprotein N-acyltransferase
MKKELWFALLGAAMLCSGWLGFTGLPMLGALVPLMILSGNADTSWRGFWRTYRWVALAMCLWGVVPTWWVWYATPAGPIASAVIQPVLMGGVFMLYHFVSKQAPKPLVYTVLVSAWIAAEYLYTVGQVSFPWLVLGNGFAWDVRLVQWYDTTGVFGGSLWVLICNILIYEAITARSGRKWVGAALAALMPVCLSLVRYRTYEMPEATATTTVVQPNIDPYKKFDEIPRERQVALLLDLAAKAPYNTEWIVTPETALADPIREDMFAESAPLAQFRTLMRYRYPGAQAILGASTQRLYMDGGQSWTAHHAGGDLWHDYYNTVIGVDSSANVQVRHKSVLLIGVEMTPYYKWLRDARFLTVDMGGVSGQLGVDPAPRVFRSPRGTLSGVAVCWEGVFGGYMGGFTRSGAQMIHIISNDGWWGDTPGHRQLFAFARLRAVELRRSIARSANTGKSGFIDPRGDELSSLGWNERGTLSAALPLSDKMTFYARRGDYIARLASYVLALSLLCFIAYRVRHKDHLI